MFVYILTEGNIASGYFDIVGVFATKELAEEVEEVRRLQVSNEKYNLVDTWDIIKELIRDK